MDLATFDTGLLRATIERALRRGGDFAEVFIEDRDSLGLRLEDGRIEQTSGGRETGAAVRLLTGERTYYAYSDAVDEAGLSAAADAVAAAVSAGAQGPEIVHLGAVRADPGKNPVLTPPGDVAIARKALLVRAGDEAARAASSEIVQATIGYGDTRQRVLIANSLGDLVYDDRTRTRFIAQVVARRGDVIQTGHETVGGSAGFELVDEDIARTVARTAAEKATIMLDSKPAPVGAMPVVLGQRLRRHPVPRGLRPRARGRRDRQGRQHLRRQARRDRRGGHRQRLRRGLHRQRLGLPGVRRRGRPDAEDDGHRGRPAHRLPLRSPARPRGGRRAHGQRAAPVVPPRAHPAHDDHVHRARRRHARRTSSRRRPRASTPRAWPAGRSSRPAATSSSGSPRAT